MTIDIRDIQKAQQESLDKREHRTFPFVAKIVEVNGSTSPPNRPNLVWVMEYAQPDHAFPVFNDRVVPVNGLPVLVVEDPQHKKQLKIEGIYTGAILEGEEISAGAFNLPLHAPNHQMPSESSLGIDPVKIYQPALTILKTEGQSTLIVVVGSYIYNNGGTRFELPKQNLDLTTHVPGIGLIRYVLVYLDLDSNALAILDGVAVLNNGIIPIPLPSIPSNAIPSAYVKLANGQTSITTATHIVDTRDFLGANSVANPYTAEQVGQVLYSTNGITFSSELPLTSSEGWLVNGEGILLVVG